MTYLYCCGCELDVIGRLTDGREIYPHRSDLGALPFWKCDACGNFVGCHHKTAEPTKPLGCIPTKEIKAARQQLHKLIDPIWKGKHMSRKAVYEKISAGFGREYHTAEIRSLEEARQVWRIAKELSLGVGA